MNARTSITAICGANLVINSLFLEPVRPLWAEAAPPGIGILRIGQTNVKAN